MNRTLVAAAVLMVAAPAAAQDMLTANSVWVNGRGSVMTITSVDPTGLLTGSYVNNATGFACQGTSYPLTGWVYPNSISFTVEWTNPKESCDSITSWTGALQAGGIATQWTLVAQGASGPVYTYGQDTFYLDGTAPAAVDPKGTIGAPRS